jgi:hypothetical protein
VSGHGRPRPLLLPQPRLPRPRQARSRQPHRHHPLWPLPARLLRCRTCKARSSERKGTPLFDFRLPPEKAQALLRHLADGCGVRQTGWLAGVDKNTAVRYRLQAGGHARRLADELVALSPRTTKVQLDEK